jgi:hypothetical protein
MDNVGIQGVRISHFHDLADKGTKSRWTIDLNSRLEHMFQGRERFVKRCMERTAFVQWVDDSVAGITGGGYNKFRKRGMMPMIWSAWGKEDEERARQTVF